MRRIAPGAEAPPRPYNRDHGRFHGFWRPSVDGHERLPWQSKIQSKIQNLLEFPLCTRSLSPRLMRLNRSAWF